MLRSASLNDKRMPGGQHENCESERDGILNIRKCPFYNSQLIPSFMPLETSYS